MGPAGLIAPGELKKLPSQPPDWRLAYGSDPSQYGELRLPPGPGPHPVAVLIHGGCFKAAYATLRDLAAFGDALKSAGIATWNIEYRRLGQPGGGWPGTYLDVGMAVGHLRALAGQHSLDLNRVVIVGHSAGGHLAMWVAARARVPKDSAIRFDDPLPVRGVLDLAGPVDLTANIAGYEGLCRDSVITDLLGGTPATVPERYAQASPIRLLPLGVPQVLLMGEHEDFVPRPFAEAYVRAAAQAGDQARLIVIPRMGHFDIASPRAPPWPQVKSAIEALLDGQLPSDGARAHENAATGAPDAMATKQDYPSRPVRIIEPFGAGGGPDLLARALAPKLSELWHQTVTVENLPGAGATAAPALVAKSVADGYTLLLNTSAQAYTAALSKSLPYDPLKDFIPIAALTSQPYVLVTGKSVGVTSLGELVAAAKAKPGDLTFASTGPGTGTHLGAVKFNYEAGIKAVDVPPQPNAGISGVLAGTIEGRTTYMFAPISAATLPSIRDGKLIALGVSTARRSSLLPDVPTIAEAGVAGFDFPIWYGIWAPAGTPAEVVERLGQDITQVLAGPDLREWLATHGAERMSMTQPEFAKFVQDEKESAVRLMKTTGVKQQ